MTVGQGARSQVGAAARQRWARRLVRLFVGALAVLVGVLAIALGAALFLSARPAQPVRVEGIIRDYRAVFIGGSYARGELKLVDDPHIYTFNRGDFSPSLPDRFYQNGQAILWTDGAGGQVIALTLDDEHGLNAITYTTLAYDNPQAPFWLGQSEGVGAAVMGLALAAGAPILLVLRGPRQKPRRARGPASRATDDSLPALEHAAIEMPAVVIAGHATRPPAIAASVSPPAAPRSNPAGVAQGERTLHAVRPADGTPHLAHPPAIDELPTARTPSISMPQMRRPTLPAQPTPPTQSTPPMQPAARSNPSASGSMPDSMPLLPRFGPGGSSSGPDAGAYIPGDPWEGHQSAVRDQSASRPGTRLVPMAEQGSQPSAASPAGPSAPAQGASVRDVEDAPTARTPAVAPPGDEHGHAPRAPLWPPARDTNGH